MLHFEKKMLNLSTWTGVTIAENQHFEFNLFVVSLPNTQHQISQIIKSPPFLMIS